MTTIPPRLSSFKVTWKRILIRLQCLDPLTLFLLRLKRAKHLKTLEVNLCIKLLDKETVEFLNACQELLIHSNSLTYAKFPQLQDITGIGKFKLRDARCWR